jgi:hypothetical protein
MFFFYPVDRFGLVICHNEAMLQIMSLMIDVYKGKLQISFKGKMRFNQNFFG